MKTWNKALCAEILFGVFRVAGMPCAPRAGQRNSGAANNPCWAKNPCAAMNPCVTKNALQNH